MDYQLKQSGEKQTFASGAQRDSQTGKSRYDLIPALSLRRVADLYTKGAEHYGDWNWAKGMPFTRFLSSLYRHLQQFIMEEDDEDHLAAIVFNALSMIHFQEEGRTDLDDRRRQFYLGKNLTSDETEPTNKPNARCWKCNNLIHIVVRTDIKDSQVWEVWMCQECHTETCTFRKA